MKQRSPLCKYCWAPLTTGTTRKEFCGGKCRVYFNREKAAAGLSNNLKSIVVDDQREYLPQESQGLPDKIVLKVPRKGKYMDERRKLKSGAK